VTCAICNVFVIFLSQAKISRLKTKAIGTEGKYMMFQNVALAIRGTTKNSPRDPSSMLRPFPEIEKNSKLFGLH